MTQQTAAPLALEIISLMPVGGLPAPFRTLGCLRAGPAASAPSAVGAQLRYAWVDLQRGDGTTQTAGELWVAEDTRGWLAAAPLSAAGAGLLVLADGLPAAGPLPEPPRALSPGIDLRLLAGTGFGRESTVLADRHCALAVVRLARMMRFEFRPEHPRRTVVVAAGSVTCGGQTLIAGQHYHQSDARTFFIDALEASVLVLVAGEA